MQCASVHHRVFKAPLFLFHPGCTCPCSHYSYQPCKLSDLPCSPFSILPHQPCSTLPPFFTHLLPKCPMLCDSSLVLLPCGPYCQTVGLLILACSLLDLCVFLKCLLWFLIFPASPAPKRVSLYKMINYWTASALPRVSAMRPGPVFLLPCLHQLW